MNDSLPFLQKVCLVTGSGRGIGKAIALQFAKLGADVIINYFRNRKPAEETSRIIQAMGRQTKVIKANIGEIDEINLLFKEIEKDFGRLDFMICNAASGYNRQAMQQKPKGWDWTMNINARSVLFCAQQAVPLMEASHGGAIVAISSPGARRVLPDYIAVGASKAAIEALVRYLAVELAKNDIRVNAVSPGVVETDALQHFDALSSDPDLIRNTIAMTPAGRLVTPEDIARVTAFLCSEDALMIRGQVLTVDGGAGLLGKLWTENTKI